MIWSAWLVSAFRAYITPVLILTGVPGNIFLIVCFTVLQHRARCRFNLYVIWTSVAYVLELLMNGLLDDFIGRGLTFLTDGAIVKKLDNESEFSCKFLTVASKITTFAASNLLLLFTIDRLLTIYYPMRFRGDRFVGRAKVAIAIVYLLGLVFFAVDITIMGLNQEEEGSYDCAYLDQGSAAATYSITMYSVSSFILPTIAISIINIFIGFEFRKTSRRQDEMRHIKDKRSNPELRRILGHLSASSTFVFFTIPLVVTVLLRLQAKNYATTHPVYYRNVVNMSKFFSSFKAIYYAMDFFLYVFFLPNVRSLLLELCCFCACCAKTPLGRFILARTDTKLTAKTRRRKEKRAARDHWLAQQLEQRPRSTNSAESELGKSPCLSVQSPHQDTFRSSPNISQDLYTKF